MEKNKGITLIALVVTVVVLLILASVTVGTLMGKNSTIKKAQEAKREQEISQEREIVELSAVQAADKDKFGNVEEENLRQALIDNIGEKKFTLSADKTKFTIVFPDGTGTKHYIWKDIPILTNANVKFTYDPSGWTNQNVTATVETTIEGYIIQTSKNGKDWTSTNKQVYSENGIVYVRLANENGQNNNQKNEFSGNVTNIDKTKPIITSVTATTNSIKLTATDEASGIVGYTATTSNEVPTNFTKCTSTKTLNATIPNVKQNTTYYVWVKDQAGNVNVSKTIKTQKVPDLTTANVKFTYNPSTWTNKDVVATAKATVGGYTIETSTDNKAWTAINKQTRSTNGPVYVRLKDSTGQVGGVATGNVTNIDKELPKATIALSGAGTVASNPKITATITHIDNESGVKTRKYIFNSNGENIGTDENNYDMILNSNMETVEIPLEQNGKYYLHVLTTDNAGNKKETISNMITLTANVHEHTGDATNGGGCYVTPVYHTHKDDCYHKQYVDDYKYEYIRDEGTSHAYLQVDWHEDCSICKRDLYHAWNPGWVICPSKHVLCNKSDEIEKYELGCGKQDGQLDGYIIKY